MWSYNIEGIAAGAVPISPVLSLDGTKVAFVESASGAAHFHVLAWKSGDGVDATNKQNVLKPKVISSGFATSAPSAGNVTDLNFGSSTDTLSSPYIDYANDTAYVGNDAGALFRFKNVFCTTAGCGSAAPSLDLSWGAGTGSVTVCSGKLTAPVIDVTTNKVYVGCSDGKLYSITQGGTVSSITVGDGSVPYGGIVDPPLVDSTNKFVYVTAGSANAQANAVLVQAKTDFSSTVVSIIGVGNRCTFHSPAPNNAYLTSITSAGSLLYAGGLSTGATDTVGQPCTGASTGTATVFLYGLSFGTGGVMNATPANSLNLGTGAGFEWAPMAEFFDTTTSADWLFIAALQSGQNNLGTANVSGAFPAYREFQIG